MLKDFVKAVKPEDEEFAKRLEEERSKLFAAQMKIKDARAGALQEREAYSAGSSRISTRDFSGSRHSPRRQRRT